jgi:hypothetical protein
MANGAPRGGATGRKTVLTFFAALVIAVGVVVAMSEPWARSPASGSGGPQGLSDSASRDYERIWKEDRRYFGDPGKPAPNVLFVATGEGYTTTGAVGDQWGAPRVINIGLTAREQLTSTKPQPRNSARFAIEHEFGRYFGPDLPLVSGSGNAGAGLANLVANCLAHNRNTGRGNPRRILRNRLPYWGQNPATIMFPGRPDAL